MLHVQSGGPPRLLDDLHASRGVDHVALDGDGSQARDVDRPRPGGSIAQRTAPLARPVSFVSEAAEIDGLSIIRYKSHSLPLLP